MTEVATAGRSDAVQLLRQATDARLKKPALDKTKLRRSRSFNAYPGFIPDPEVLERQEILRKQSQNSLSIASSKVPPSSITVPLKYQQDSNSPNNNHKPRTQVAFRKSGLPSKKTLAQRRSRAIHAKSPQRSSKGYGPFRRAVNPSPILKTDPPGFLISRLNRNEEPAATSPLGNSSTNETTDVNQRQLLRRSRSFNTSQDKDRARYPNSPPSPSFGNNYNSAHNNSIHRSKSQRQVPKSPNNDILDLLGIPYNNASKPSQTSPAVVLRNWLTAGHKVCAMPDTPETFPDSMTKRGKDNQHRENNSPKDEVKSSKLMPKPSLGPGLGRMRSLKWIGKKKSPELQPESDFVSNSKLESLANKTTPELLSRSKTTRDKIPNKLPKLGRSNTTRLGNGEIIRSLKSFFDGFSLKSRTTQLPEVQLVNSPDDLEEVKKSVVQNPELQLKKIVIHDSSSNSTNNLAYNNLKPTSSHQSDKGPINNEGIIITPNIGETVGDYFTIPVRSSRRPSKVKEEDPYRGTNLTILEERSFTADAFNHSSKNQVFRIDYSEPVFPVLAQKCEGVEFAKAMFRENPPASPDLNNKPLPELPDNSLPSYKLVHDGPVKQIIDSTTIKDRHLFLFEHILVISRPLTGNISQFIITKVIWVDAINEVTQRLDNKADTPTEEPSVPVLPRKYIPVIMATIRRFEIEPASAIGYLVGRGAVKPDPSAIARLLHNTPEFDRRMLGRFLALEKSNEILDGFLLRLYWRGLRLDLALQTLLLAIKLPNQKENELTILNRVAYHWHMSNRNSLPLSSLVPLMTTLLQLSQIRTGDPLSLEQLVNDFDLSDHIEELKLVYNSVLNSPLVECNDHSKLPVGLGGRSSSRFIQNEASDPIWVKIPSPDPNLQIILHGSGIVCDPPILDFSVSDTQQFTVTGSLVGRLSLMLIPVGTSAGKYEFITTKTFVVEPIFMKHTLAISFPTPEISASSHEDVIIASPALTAHSQQARKRCLFGMITSSELTQWTESIENTIDLYQEAQDEWAAQLEDENSDDNSIWIAQAEETSQIRHKALASSAVKLFEPLFNRPLTRVELISLASCHHDGVPPPISLQS